MLLILQALHMMNLAFSSSKFKFKIIKGHGHLFKIVPRLANSSNHSRVQISSNLYLYYRDFQRNHGWDLQSGANEFAENFGKLERYATCC